MRMTQFAVAMCLCAFTTPGVMAQTTEAADERARLANQRIQAEADRQAREEALRQAQAAAEPGQSASTDAIPNAEPADVTKALEQLKMLGELKDAGYVTDAEFSRIKQKILDSQF